MVIFLYNLYIFVWIQMVIFLYNLYIFEKDYIEFRKMIICIQTKYRDLWSFFYTILTFLDGVFQKFCPLK